ncbi:MAG TPA: hemolysin family protein [Pyrinomonadaceae bacterium]|jgi:CBS domain containing-hemolysin-like protein|nr:hemolysin family protein [Pyrinomonadaceae bacterium]
MLTVLNLFLVLLLVFLNGFFVAAEFAFVGVRRSRIETMAAGGDRRASRLIEVLDNLNAYLSASQLGITLASLALGWIGEPAFAHMLEGPLSNYPVLESFRHPIAFAFAFSIITTLHIVLGEQAPKLLGLERAERVALATAWPLQIFYRLFSWPIRALDWASARTVRLFGLHPSHGHGTIYTEEELRQLVDASRRSGHLELEEQRLINRVLDFNEAEVREAMVPRTAMDALPSTATLEDAKRAFRSLGYSRLPVYRERLDDIVGVLFRRDLEPFLEQPQAGEFKLETILHAPLFIPATARLGSALTQMQSTRTHLAFAIDEHGGVEGIVTLEDLLEEIVGEINDEFDEETREQIKEDNGAYVLDGMLAIRDANRHLKLNLPEDVGYTTLAGFLLDKAGRMLRQGESVEHDGARFTVERLERRRIRRIRLTLPATDGAQSSA